MSVKAHDLHPRQCKVTFSVQPLLWWGGYLFSLLLPLVTLAFMSGGPWPWWQALAWTTPVWLLIAADWYSPVLRFAPPAHMPRWPFNGILLLLSLIQPINITAMARLVSLTEWGDLAQIMDTVANLAAVRILMGTTSCCAAIAPAHELIHRRSLWYRLLGRMLLCTVLYDHFAVTHRRLHHRHVNGRLDPASANPGESYEHFFRRTAVMQWRSSWALDRKGTALGVVAEILLLVAITWCFGPLALLMFVYQAVVAVRLLEAVNFFQHWGLQGRTAGAWLCDNAVSLFVFLGLPRHADHHRHALKPYQALRRVEQGPVLWRGYLCMALLVKNRCHVFRRRASEILDSTYHASR